MESDKIIEMADGMVMACRAAGLPPTTAYAAMTLAAAAMRVALGTERADLVDEAVRLLASIAK